ncbi:hypothetical protein TRVL_09974 [Trypanosoma vivax]|nr:hypothetical protein TRVL_09974 [Trypanosoma vivax]
MSAIFSNESDERENDRNKSRVLHKCTLQLLQVTNDRHNVARATVTGRRVSRASHTNWGTMALERSLYSAALHSPTPSPKLSSERANGEPPSIVRHVNSPKIFRKLREKTVTKARWVAHF